MRYLFAGGGTGGHIYPAITLIEELQVLDPDAEILYVGTATGREAKVVPQAGIPFVTISSGGLINLSFLAKIKGGFKALKGISDSLAHIRRFKPDVVIGTGGFVSGPVLLAARLVGKPVVIQEQNAFPGFTNRIAARWAKAVFVPYEEARPHFPPSAQLRRAGNPVRTVVGSIKREQGREAFGFAPSDQVVLITGGSGGARDFNHAVVAAISALLPTMPNLKVLHATGERYFDQVQAQYAGQVGVTIVPYLHNMPEAYAAADCGVFRAGAITLAEVQVCGIPSVLIPSPNVTHNHQEWNARTLEQRGAALVVRESDMSVERLSAAIRSLLTNPTIADAMRLALRELAQPEAARTIAIAIHQVAQGRTV
jgi:UDP-N-acetylglucosamine--N-acetylmuramyl-(pentapeptide) pyrophosphoryl-undecaprenol N-acetylglucosamine transferase